MAETEYVVGYEMQFGDLLHECDVNPLLCAIIDAGTEFAGVIDVNGRLQWSSGDVWSKGNSKSYETGLTAAIISDMLEKGGGCDWFTSPLHHEGETVGFVVGYMNGVNERDVVCRAVTVVAASLNLMIGNNVKRRLTTEMHDMVMHENYKELVGVNERLSASEQKYRELAHSLEQKVEEKVAELQDAATKLITQKKLAAVGQLAAGIAHEINNPLGFVFSNMNTLQRYVSSFVEMIEFYRTAFRDAHGSPVQPLAESYTRSEELYGKLRIDYIKEDTNALINENIVGTERIKQIVSDMKDFSHIDESANVNVDINGELNKTVNVLSNDIKDKSATVVKRYGDVPAIVGNPALICHCFMNVVLNAISSTDSGATVTITTEERGGNIIVTIADDGDGMDEDIQKRIFEPFYTTRAVGVGTGMGLAAAYDIVVGHHGTIDVDSEPGRGTNIIITLPPTAGTIGG